MKKTNKRLVLGTRVSCYARHTLGIIEGRIDADTYIIAMDAVCDGYRCIVAKLEELELYTEKWLDE